MWPQDAVIGQATELTYWVRSYNSSGFDQLDIKTQAPVEVVRSVQIDGTDVAWDQEDSEDDDGKHRRRPNQLPEDHRRRPAAARRVREHRALHYNTVFIGRIFDTQRPHNLPQTLVPGDVDADPVAEGDDLSVTTRVADNRIYFLEAAPAPFTPNGDGVNDQTIVTYDIVNLTGGNSGVGTSLRPRRPTQKGDLLRPRHRWKISESLGRRGRQRTNARRREFTSCAWKSLQIQARRARLRSHLWSIDFSRRIGGVTW